MEKKQPIRVAHIIGKMVGGGLESFLLTYYENIDRTKIQFDFIIDSDSTIVPRKEIERLGGRIIEVSPYQHIFSYIKDVRKILKENDYKIVHAHMNTLSVFPLYAAWKEKVPVRIAHSHSTTNKKEWKKNLIKEMLRPFSKIFATDYFACSEHAGRWLFGNKTFENGKVTIIRNAINTDKFKYDEKTRHKIRNEMNLEDKFVIGHVGRFVAQKNHSFLIDIFNEVHKKNNNSVLLLIGQGPLENEIKEKVKKMNLQNVVLFLEQRENVNEIMQAMDCFVFPSLYEGLGIVVIEAQCSGLPCICSDNVPSEVKMNDNVYFCNLSKIGKWIESINEISLTSRKNEFNEIINDKYEINNKVLELEKIYINFYKEIVNG